MDPSQIYSSGALKKGEDVVDSVIGNMLQTSGGLVVITNRRLIYLKKPGLFSKGLDLLVSISLGDILSISTAGLINKQINIKAERERKVLTYNCVCKNAEIFAKKIRESKENFVEEKTIEAKTVIIEEGKKDRADEILKKRLARGEITLEEFHEKIQRT